MMQRFTAMNNCELLTPHYSVNLQGMTLSLITTLTSLSVQVSLSSRVTYQALHTQCYAQLQTANLTV